MKKWSIPAALLFSGLLVFGFAMVPMKNQTPIELKKISPPPTYDKEWAKVDSLQKLGLTKSALEVVDKIYTRASKEHNEPQQVKALLHISKYTQYVEEQSMVKNLNLWQEEEKKADYPLKPVLQSVLAETFANYTRQNSWRFSNRTETVDFDNNDISTWDLKTLTKKSLELYLASLENKDSLMTLPADYFGAILTEGKDAKRYRPSMYDFLAHRAVDFFMNEASYLTQPSYRFEIDQREAFASASTFARYDFTSQDTFSFKLAALGIFQDLLAYHIRDKEPYARVDADLKRLKFVWNNSIHPEKDELYLDALESLKKEIGDHEASTWVTAEIATFWMREGGEYNRLSEDEEHRYDLVKAHELCETAFNKYADFPGGQKCGNLMDRIEQESLSLKVETVNVPGRPFRGLVTYKNLTQTHFRLAKLPEDYFKQQNRLYGEELLEYFKKLPVVSSWSQPLPDTKDYQEHAVEIKIPACAYGSYVLLAGTDENLNLKKEEAVAHTFFHVSDLSYAMIQDNDYNQEVFVMDRTTGHPLKGVKATTWVQEYNYTTRNYEYVSKGTYSSDSDGAFTVKRPAKNKSFNYFIELENGKDRLLTGDAFYAYGRWNREQKTRYETRFFTDRGIYRPGQTVYFKAILLKHDGETPSIRPNTNVTVELMDPNYQVVEKLQLRSNEYGTVQGTFTAPKGVITGQFRLRETHGNHYFSVEEYKRPKFEVKFDPVKGSFRLGDDVTVKGNAKAYAGSNVDGAEVRYRVLRQASYPWFGGWWRWGWNLPSTPSMEIENGTTTTDETGNFEVTFKAIADRSISKDRLPQFQYTVYADVTDISGETRSSSVVANVGYIALNASLGIPGQLPKEKPFKCSIRTTNLNGEPEPAKGSITIKKLKNPGQFYRNRMWEQADQYVMSEAEYHRIFPNDVYENEDDFHVWEEGKTVLSTNFDTKDGDTLRLDKLADWEMGKYVVELKTEDKFGKEVTLKKYFTLFSNSEGKLALPEMFSYQGEKLTTEPGEEARFQIGTSAIDAKILYQVEFKGEIIKREWLNLNNSITQLSIPVEEKHRGNLAFSLMMVREGRFNQTNQTVIVPWSNKRLKLEFETFRDKLLPGQEEEWRMKISGPEGEKVAAELVAAMYDASLDAFKGNSWWLSPWQSRYSQFYWQGTGAFNIETSSMITGKEWNTSRTWSAPEFHFLNYFGWSGWSSYYGYYFDDFDGEGEVMMDMAVSESPAPAMEEVAEDEIAATGSATTRSGGAKREMNGFISGGGGLAEQQNADFKTIALDNTEGQDASKVDMGDVKIRTNLNETAFFFPQLKTNEEGETILAFTVPEALTRWKVMGLAHTTDLKTGQITKETVTQKDLMVMPNVPRFLREKDEILFTAKVSNLSDGKLSGNAQLVLMDALTGKNVDADFGNTNPTIAFSAAEGQSDRLEWRLKVPENVQAVTIQVKAKAGNFTDGEENVLPVLSNRLLVTESMPLPVRERQTREFTMTKLVNNKSKSLKHHRLTLEFTSNPAWYAIQALPYLMEYPYECNEQTFSRFYANSIASHVANSHPRIKKVFDSWRNQDKEALLSNLEKNQELKALLLEETPWVLQSQDETARKKRVGLLFDLNRMANEEKAALKKLQKNQVSNGGWPWFAGGPDSRYITQHIVTGMGHLDHLGVRTIREDNATWNMVRKAVVYCDNRIREDYDRLLKMKVDMKKDHLSSIQIHYLYARTYFMDVPVNKKNREAYDYYLGQGKEYWLNKSRYNQGMLSLALHREKEQETAMKIIRSLKENSLYSDEMGRYWKSNTGGFYWYEAPIETQALLIEAFDEVANDQSAVEEMKVWLLKQKQTQDWKTTKATSEACYALLLRGTDLLAESELAEITVGGKKVDPNEMDDVKVEAGTGYFKTSWSGAEIEEDMGKVKVKNKNNTVAWGALYWQYFEDMDKVTPHETPLKLTKKLFLEKPGDTGPVITPVTDKTKLRPGDKVKVRIELRVDRRMEYLHMKDMRASGFEPINVFSRYKFQDGLGYYESTRDASTNFFITAINPGTYVFEYPVRVSHSGDFANGVTTIQCMYAPEFTSHSEGIRVQVGE